LYVVVSYTRSSGHVIRPGLSLVQAYHLLRRLGRGAIFRAEGMSVYARPVYPFVPRPSPRPAGSRKIGGPGMGIQPRSQGRVA
jgi:hypothetical protein